MLETLFSVKQMFRVSQLYLVYLLAMLLFITG